MINEFKGKYCFLSNFYTSKVKYKDLEFDNNEAAFHSAKTLDIEVRKQFCKLDPSIAKRKGRSIALRQDWEEIKYQVMEDCVRDKFTRNEDLKWKLINTGKQELIEGNYWHDNIWGNCYCNRCKNIVGKNMLGKILMKIRAKLQEEIGSDCYGAWNNLCDKEYCSIWDRCKEISK